jgi:predicted RND superfamily exporter protein
MNQVDAAKYPLFPAPQADFYDLFEEFLSNPMIEAKYMHEKHIILNKDKKRVDVLTVSWQSEFIQLAFYAPENLHDKFDAWKKFETDLNKDAPEGAKNGFGTTGPADGVWMNYAMTQEFVDSVYRCGAISAVCALVFLVAATQDFRVVTVSMLSICATVITTWGSMWVYGWELGIIEAICATLAAGFAVDYTIHYAIAYVERKPEHDGLYNLGSTRDDRVRSAFFELGPPVVSGYITTCGAAVFLWNSQSSFFQVFGTFLCTVVTWSVLYSNFFFMPLLSIFGPDHGAAAAKPTEANVQPGKDTTPATLPSTTDNGDKGEKSDDEVSV